MSSRGTPGGAREPTREDTLPHTAARSRFLRDLVMTGPRNRLFQTANQAFLTQHSNSLQAQGEEEDREGGEGSVSTLLSSIQHKTRPTK